MKKLTILLLCVALASCGSQSGKREPNLESDDRTVFFRAQHTWISTVTYDRLVNNKIEIISADSAFKPGDTITVDDVDYILRERVK